MRRYHTSILAQASRDIHVSNMPHVTHYLLFMIYEGKLEEAKWSILNILWLLLCVYVAYFTRPCFLPVALNTDVE